MAFVNLPRDISHDVRQHNNAALTPVADLKGNRTCSACQMDAKVKFGLFQALMPHGVSEGSIRESSIPLQNDTLAYEVQHEITHQYDAVNQYLHCVDQRHCTQAGSSHVLFL
jgi:hypothetical protein